MENKKDKKISIKINGEKKEFNEDIFVHDWKLGKAETAAGEENLEENGFDWILPDDEPQAPQEYKKINYVGENKKKTKTFKNPFHDSASLLMSLVGAIVVGAVLGFGTLKVITTTEGPSTPVASLEEDTTSQNNEGKEKLSAVELKAFSTSVLQGGVFSTEESLKAMKESLSSKGVSSASIKKDGQWFLLLGVSGDVQTAKLLGEELTKQGVEVYAKDFQIEAKGINASSGEKSFLEKANSLYGIIAQESSNQVLMGSTNKSVITSMQASLKELEGIKVQQPAIIEMKKSIENAGKLTANMKSPEEAKKVQGELLTYLENYDSL